MFGDRLQAQIDKTGSYLCAGFDPDLDTFPKFILEAASKNSSTEEEYVYEAITSFYLSALEVLHSAVACVKPNIAFYERYGIGGIRAFVALCSAIKELKIPNIVDAKRGDIGNTARNYAQSYFGSQKTGLFKSSLVDADAITVNPFLGFDTLAPFLEVAKERGKGIFVLVKTSNPGSGDIQDIQDKDGITVSERVADWTAKHAEELRGSAPFSGLGAVVGATHPDHARALRARMPRNFFLIPGVGAQGGSVEEALAGFSKDPKGGAIAQVSRGIFSQLKARDKSEMLDEISSKVAQFRIAL